MQINRIAITVPRVKNQNTALQGVSFSGKNPIASVSHGDVAPHADQFIRSASPERTTLDDTTVKDITSQAKAAIQSEDAEGFNVLKESLDKAHVKLDLSNTQFSELDLSDFNFKGVKFKNTTFSNVLLWNTSFEGADLTNGHFSKIDCRNTNFSDSQLEQSTFNHCNLLGADFNKVDLRNTQFDACCFYNSKFKESQFSKSQFKTCTQLPTALELTADEAKACPENLFNEAQRIITESDNAQALRDLTQLPAFDINRRTTDGDSLLHLAIFNHNTEMLKALLESPNIEVNIKDASEETPLHKVIMLEQLERVKLLLQSPHIDVNAVNHHGETPLHFATHFKNNAIIEALRNRPD